MERFTNTNINWRVPVKMKKGVFTPYLVLFTLFILSTLVFTISRAEEQKKLIRTGEPAISILALYNEGERISFFLEDTSKISIDETLKILKENAGYPEKNSCQKQSNIIIWNTCQYFNVEENFNLQLNETITNYIKQYPKELPNPIITDNLIEFKDINEMKRTGNRGLIDSYSFNYLINKKIELNKDLSIYHKLYDAAQSCNLGTAITDKEIDSCIDLLKSVENTVITKNNEFLKVENNGLKILINTKQTLQAPKKPITIV